MRFPRLMAMNYEPYSYIDPLKSLSLNACTSNHLSKGQSSKPLRLRVAALNPVAAGSLHNFAIGSTQMRTWAMGLTISPDEVSKLEYPYPKGT